MSEFQFVKKQQPVNTYSKAAGVLTSPAINISLLQIIFLCPKSKKFVTRSFLFTAATPLETTFGT